MSEEPCTIYINEKSGYDCLAHVKGPVKIIGDPNCVRINDIQLPYPPLMCAARNVHDNHVLVKTLIEMGADVNAEECPGGETALDFAALWHRRKIVEVLLEHGADAHHASIEGYTPLHAAAISYVRQRDSPKYENDLSVMRALLQKKPDVNARTDEGQTPLMEAVRGFHLDNVKALLKAGADASARNNFGMTCLHFLFNSTGKTDMMIELIKAGAPLQAVDKNGITPLQAFLRSVPMDEELLEDIKVLVKTALLVDNEEKENYYVNEEINNFADQCDAEVQKMRKIQLSGGLKLCDFALRGDGKSESIVDSVYEVMMKNTYKIYDDYIIAHFERKYLYEKVAEKGIYTTNDPYDIALPKDLVYRICNFLSKKDLLNLLRVFANSLPPSLKPAPTWTCSCIPLFPFSLNFGF